MSKLIGLAFAAVLLLPFANPVREKFAKYKTIEAYEIRPGILMMPRYSSDGQVCEIGLEKLHYSPEMIRLDSSLSRKEIDQIFEELVPANERGPRSKDFGGALITQGGHSLTTNIDFENVSIQIYSGASRASDQRGITADDVVARIIWKNRRCQ
jgi:hypothetical protein